MTTFVDEVAATPGGEHIKECIQCGVCSGSCPAAGEMDYTPRKIIAMVRAGMRDEVLSSSSMWHCLSCHLCTGRCPRGVEPSGIAHALTSLAARLGYRVRQTSTPIMYRSFVNSIKSNGRVHEVGVMMVYYLMSNPLAALKMTSVALNLLLHKRMPIMPPKTEGKAELNRIIKKFKEVRERAGSPG
jgi:heterodisulfide reductase subunit C